MPETTKHTPGPWTATLGYTPTVKAGEELLCVPSARADELGGRQLSELHANARLIAAAPELLEACQEAKHLLAQLAAQNNPLPVNASDFSTVYGLLRAAIAKATQG